MIARLVLTARRRHGITVAWLAVSLLTAAGASSSAEERRVKLYVDAPGVYAVTAEHVAKVLGSPPDPALALWHRDQRLPLWRRSDDAGDRLVFLVPAERFERPHRLDGSPMLVLQLASTGSEPADEAGAAGAASAVDDLPVAAVERVRRFERDASRAPIDRATASAGVESTWYEKMISHQASSRHTIGLGELPDRGSADPEMVVTVGLLGWSDPKLLNGLRDHRVDVLLDGEPIGSVEWDGRRPREAELAVPPSVVAGSTDNRLELDIPKRRRSPDAAGTGDEIVDLVYVDWVGVRYRAEPPLADGDAPLRLVAADEPRWLPAPRTTADAAAVSSAGWWLDRDPRGGFVVPASGDPEPVELWVVEPEQVRAPIAIEPTTPGAGDLSKSLDYVMIAPRSMLSTAERLADLHRGRGLRVAVVDVVAIYDAFGDGEKSPRAVRRFLDHVLVDSPNLRYVLLAGDADWLIAEDTTPLLADEPARRDRVPTFVRPSAYGPAPSDHLYAADTDEPGVPRFAVGRLPAVDADELDAVIDKILTHVRAPRPSGPETLLMLSDRTRPSLGRRDKLAERIADAGFALRRPDDDPGSELDEAVIAALDRSPTVVYFGGHGSRYQWQLGETAVAGPERYFEREDVARLAPARRWPVVLSISCATAPFDHPATDSLGEVMVLSPERGAIAFLGAGVRLYTPRIFSDELVRALAREPTLGDAVVAAKRAAARQPHVAELYNLLGDPALPLR